MQNNSVIGEGAKTIGFTREQVHAVKALHAGNATPEQQKLAFDWIVHEACGMALPLFYSGEEGRRATDFMTGRVFGGQQIFAVAMATMDKLFPQTGSKKETK